MYRATVVLRSSLAHVARQCFHVPVWNHHVRPYASSSSHEGDSVDNNTSVSAGASSPSQGPPRPRLLTHTSPLDLLPTATAEPPPPSLGPSLLDQLGVTLNPHALASSSADTGRPRRPARRDAPPKRDSDRPSSQSQQQQPRLAKPRSNNNKPKGRPVVSVSSPSLPSSPRSLDRWDPLKKLPRSTMDRLRFLHAQDPKTFSPGALATAYGIGYESVKRILRSKFVPLPERAQEMDARRAERKQAWRKERAREVREKLARERSEAEAQADKVRRVEARDDEKATVGRTKAGERSSSSSSSSRSTGKQGGVLVHQEEEEEGWGWLAKPASINTKNKE